MMSTVLILCALVTMPGPLEPMQDAWWVGLGVGGALESPSVAYGHNKGEWGMSLAFVMNSEYARDDVLNHRCPHQDYKVIDEKAHVGNSIGIDLVRYLELRPEHSFFVGGGFCVGTVYTVAMSNTNGQVYRHGEKKEVLPSWILGYQRSTDGTIVRFSMHSTRGFELGIGVDW